MADYRTELLEAEKQLADALERILDAFIEAVPVFSDDLEISRVEEPLRKQAVETLRRAARYVQEVDDQLSQAGRPRPPVWRNPV